MAEFEARIEVAADPASAFEYLSDFVNVAEWDPSVRDAKALTEGVPEIGSSYAVTTGFYGKAIELIYEIRTIESPTRLELSVEGGRARGHNEIVVEQMVVGANGSSSTVRSIITYRLTIELKGVARLLDRGLQLALNGMGENAVDGLEKRLNG